MIKVLFFSSLQDIGAGKELNLDIPSGYKVSDLISNLEAQYPKLKQFRSTYRVAVNQELATNDTLIPDGSEVALLPPVSGGSGTITVKLSRFAISIDECLDKVRRPDCGAIVLFLGTVRDNHQGHKVEKLQYSTYEKMAIKHMEELAQKATSQFPIGSICIWHRWGELPVGTVCVAIAVSSAHRKEAFEACRWTIDTLKKTIPLWKKEITPDGSIWLEEEPLTPLP